jgi:hypothetical protein
MGAALAASTGAGEGLEASFEQAAQARATRTAVNGKRRMALLPEIVPLSPTVARWKVKLSV